MRFIDFAFRLGVIFAIFGFLWGIFHLLLGILRGGRPKSIVEVYSLKFVQYFFLVDVTFLFCVQKDNVEALLPNELIMAGLILLLYFTGKLQNQQNQSVIIQMPNNPMPRMQAPLFNLKAEITVIVLSLLIFTAFTMYPLYAQNPISIWFYDSILKIEDTPVFGFIFKVIGFFVLIGILLKLVNGISYLLSGAPLVSVQRSMRNGGNKKKDDDQFDDFEEIK
jgi:hypothetical protein